nr:glycoside hydrolase family 28 protein [Clostridia bacterium]
MYNILNYGAEPNTGKLCTAAVQAAIDDCAAHGGGRVVVPGGTFVIGSIFLKSHVELHLEAGSVLMASDNLDDYNPDDAYAQNYNSVAEKWNKKHLIIAVELDDVAITGFGTINGHGDAFYGDDTSMSYATHYAWQGGTVTSKDLVNLRPGQLVCFIECTNVRIYDVTMTNATCWCAYLHGCEWVQIRGLRVFNPFKYLNTDGIDLDCCRYVTVSDCIISTGDDAIAIRCV